MLFGSLQCVLSYQCEVLEGIALSYQCEVLEGIALAIIQDSPKPHAKQLNCYCCEGRYSVVCLQCKLCTMTLFVCFLVGLQLTM